DELLQAVDLWSAQFVGLAEGVGTTQAVDDRAREILDENGLEAGIGAGENNDRKQVRQRREEIQEAVLAPEYHRRPEDRGVDSARLRHADLLLAARLGAQVLAGRVVRRMQRGDVDQPPHAARTAGIDDLARQLGVHAREVAAARLVQNAGETYTDVAAGKQAQQLRRLMHVGLDHLDRGQNDQFLLDPL